MFLKITTLNWFYKKKMELHNMRDAREHMKEQHKKYMSRKSKKPLNSVITQLIPTHLKQCYAILPRYS